MTISYTLTKEGMMPEDSLRSFKNAYNKTSKMSYYKKYQDEIENHFFKSLNENMRHQGISVDGLAESFYINITDDSIEFRTTNPYLVNAIEYGSKNIVGNRFMQPSVSSVGNFMSKKILNDANSFYTSTTPIRRTVEYGYGQNLNLSNKYGYMLK